MDINFKNSIWSTWCYIANATNSKNWHLQEPAWWSSRYNCHLQCWHPIMVPAQILTAQFLIQIHANSLEKASEYGQVYGLLSPNVGILDEDPGLVLSLVQH